MTFGEKIRNTRINLNLSQADLAKKTGISERSLYTYENGNVIPSRQKYNQTGRGYERFR